MLNFNDDGRKRATDEHCGLSEVGYMDLVDIVDKYDAWFTTPLGHHVDWWEKQITWRLAKPKPGEKVLDI